MVIVDDVIVFFFFNDTATTEIYTLSLHDALPISSVPTVRPRSAVASRTPNATTSLKQTMPSISGWSVRSRMAASRAGGRSRSEEHTSELQSRQYLVCRLLLEKKKNKIT